jgi:hypothetical protein
MDADLDVNVGKDLALFKLVLGNNLKAEEP